MVQESGQVLGRPPGVRVRRPNDEQLALLSEVSQADDEVIADLQPSGAGALRVRERDLATSRGRADRGDQCDAATMGRLTGELECQLVVAGPAESGEDGAP
jgi:hypothetical protein